ncbi:molybdate ABC transporter substrate-binding protein [Psychromonas sp.]|uniref:molybdate ABC transporter substrate-binding protein n=1 Tax=Psychromonas sp. TaxID=1884585 RepID=UPI003564703F
MTLLTKLIGGMLLLSSSFSFAGEIRVAVAGNFFKPLKILAAKFEAQTGDKILLSVGATGKLYAQISNGAPFEIFLAADQKRPAKLVEQQLAVAESQFTYAKGKLALWSKNPTLIDTQGSCLQSPELLHLAIANPKAAPYGEQAVQVLKKLGIYEQLENKLVLGQNIGQTFHYVSNGNVQQGIIALSQITTDGKITSGSAWIIPGNLYQAIQQDAVLLDKGKSNPTARAFLAYLKSTEALQIIRSFGYEVDA